MNAKTLSFIASLLTLSACQKGELPMPEPEVGATIRFDSPSVMTDVDCAVRSTGPVNLFPVGGSFGVLGYCLANYSGSNELNPSTGATSWNSKSILSTPHLFYKTEVKYNGTACYYTGQQRRWYDESDYLYTFFAYYPYGDSYYTVEPSTQSGIGIPSLTFTMPFSGRDLSTTLAIEDIPDAMAAAAIDVTRQSGQVKLSFQHLLAGINFKVSNYNGKNDLTIHGLRVSGNFYRSLKIRLSEGLEYPADTFSGTFSLLDGADAADDLLVPAQQTDTKVGDKTLMLISNLEARPHYLGSQIYIHIDYTFMGVRTTDKQFAFVPNYLPQGGTIYTIELNFIGDSFVLNFVVDNNQAWEEGGDSDIQFE